MLKKIVKKGIVYLHEQGYFFLKQNLKPELKQLKNATNIHLLAETYCLIGDLHDLNGAPLQALQSYQKAISFDKEWAAPYREVAQILAQVGRYFEAFQYINIAIEKDPDDEELISEKQQYQDDMNYDIEPLYTEKNEIWNWCERLAEERFEEVIQQILNKKTSDIEDLKCLNRAYGALEQVELYMENWKKMQEMEEEFELEDADWFYMPNRLVDVLIEN